MLLDKISFHYLLKKKLISSLSRHHFARHLRLLRLGGRRGRVEAGRVSGLVVDRGVAVKRVGRPEEARAEHWDGVGAEVAPRGTRNEP